MPAAVSGLRSAADGIGFPGNWMRLDDSGLLKTAGFIEQKRREHERLVTDVLPAHAAGGVNETRGVERLVFEVIPCVERAEGGAATPLNGRGTAGATGWRQRRLAGRVLMAMMGTPACSNAAACSAEGLHLFVAVSARVAEKKNQDVRFAAKAFAGDRLAVFCQGGPLPAPAMAPIPAGPA